MSLNRNAETDRYPLLKSKLPTFFVNFKGKLFFFNWQNTLTTSTSDQQFAFNFSTISFGLILFAIRLDRVTFYFVPQRSLDVFSLSKKINDGGVPRPFRLYE